MSMGTPIPMKTADMTKKRMMVLVRVGTGSHARRICCLNCYMNVIEPSSLLLELLESFSPSCFIVQSSQYYRMEQIHSNPIITQLRLLKQKLQQKDQVITMLTECIKTQEAALLSIVNQFQQHEEMIMRRLHRLEDINIRYIKNYLQIKQQERVEEFVPLQHMFLADNRQYIKDKVEAVRSIQSQGNGNGAAPESKKVIQSCLGLMKEYLSNRRIEYEKQVGHLVEERKRKLKETKGLEAYRQNKQEGKFIDVIKGKIERFNNKIAKMDQQNIVELFHARVDLQGEIMKLDPQKGQITLENSKTQQKMFKGIVEEIISCNAASESYFLEGSFNFIQQQLEQLSQKYGIQFVNESIGSMQGLTAQSKQNILSNRVGSRGYMNRKYGDNQQNTSIYLDSQQQIEQDNLQRQAKKGQNEIGSKKNNQKQGNKNNNDEDDDQQPLTLSMSKRERTKLPKTTGKLNQKFQTTINKTFFQEQQKSRDQLINKQESEIAQHQKVIDKLISFIKKQFKDRKMDDIDADDPEQLIGYYFKVNEKKYVDIREEMQELQKQTAKTVNNLVFQNEQLNIKLNDLKEEMDQLREKYQKSTFQLHILVSRTEDLVKISLETLISTCMNWITPEKLINQLQRIIELIKENIEKKRDITYKFTIKEQFLDGKQPKENRREYMTEIMEKKNDFGSFLSEVVNLQIQKIRENSERSNNSHLSIESYQKQPDFVQQKSQLPILEKQEIIEKMVDPPMSENIVISVPVQTTPQEEKQSEGFDEMFLNNIRQQIDIIKDRNFNSPRDQLQDMKEMYNKYKQALDCLERAEQLNREHQLKYQKFLAGLKKKGAWQCPEKLEEKLFYMQKLINEQNQLLHNQRAEYEQTILKQVNQSENLAQSILRQFRVRPRNTII